MSNHNDIISTKIYYERDGLIFILLIFRVFFFLFFFFFFFFQSRDFSNWNKISTAVFIKRAYRYHKFLRFIIVILSQFPNIIKLIWKPFCKKVYRYLNFMMTCRVYKFRRKKNNVGKIHNDCHSLKDKLQHKYSNYGLITLLPFLIAGRWVGFQTKWRLPLQSVLNGWHLTINVCDRADRAPVCVFLEFWL